MKYIFFLIMMTAFFIFLSKKFRKSSIVAMLILMLAMLIVYPEVSMNAAKEGINLWLFIVIPSLLPFFIINDMLTSLKIPENIGMLFSPVAKFLFGTSGYGAYVFIMSIFAGYPAGARITAQLIESKKITVEEGQRILTFSSTSGPLFIIGAVGSGMLKSSLAGYVLYISHILGAVLNGILLRPFFKNKCQKNNITNAYYSNSYTEDILSKGIMTSLVTSGFIGGYIILFSVIIALLNKAEFFIVLNNFLSKIPFLPQNAVNNICTILESSIEISNGSKIISASGVNFEIKLLLLSFIIAFSGLSIIGQVSSVVMKTKINMKNYVASKLCHGLFSSLVCYVILKMKLFNINTFNIDSNLFIPHTIPLIEILLLILLLLNFLSTLKQHNRK
jgi:sporulation integral membrane protein YlbJ